MVIPGQPPPRGPWRSISADFRRFNACERMRQILLVVLIAVGIIAFSVHFASEPPPMDRAAFPTGP